uniref:Cytochrome P450 n=1 Tax=Megaselia scalaris TaxID=36166 RepID=T1GJG6_MEGSC
QGETWFKLRSRLTSHITSPRILQNFLPILNVIFDDFIEVLRTKRNPNTFCVENFQDVANLMSLEAVCTLMLGRRMGFLGQNLKEEDKVMKLAAAVKQLFISQRDSYYGLGLWKYIPTKTYRDFAKSEEIIYDIVSELVDEALAENELNSADDDVNSIFYSILQTKDLDIRDKKSAIIDFIAAGIETKLKYSCKKILNTKAKLLKRRTIWDIPGPRPLPFIGLNGYSISKNTSFPNFMKPMKYGQIVLEVTTSGIPIVNLFDRTDIETVLKYPSKYPFRPPTEIHVMYRLSRPDRYASLGNTLIFAINFIANHEEAPKRIVEEFGAFKSSYILQDALTKALYTKSCLQETYRLQPTAFCLARILEEDTTLSNYDLKAGTVLLCQNRIACRSEQNFPNATKYMPERWISEDKSSNIQLENSSIVVPFGIGKRTCPGKRFVEMELLFLAFDVKLAQPLETEFEFLLAPKTPVNIILKDRVY